MSDKNALRHMISWAINNIYKTEKEAFSIIDDKELDEKKKMALLQAEHGPEYRLLNLIILLKPALSIARKEYPEQKPFFEWFDNKWDHIVKNNYILSECGCTGCKK